MLGSRREKGARRDGERSWGNTLLSTRNFNVMAKPNGNEAALNYLHEIVEPFELSAGKHLGAESRLEAPKHRQGD